MDCVFDYLKQNEARFTDELCEYLRFPSVSAQANHREDLQSCANWLVEHCRALGLKCRAYPTAGNPVVVAQTVPRRSKDRPHFLVYGHYDVQPPEPFELWESPPFEPTIVGQSLIARGSTDNKGQHFAHLKAVEAYLRTGTELPCDITFVIEGEEEVGSEHLAAFLKANRKLFEVQGVVVSDNGIPGLKYPALTYGLRGIAACEVRIDGPSRDLHSGIYGGAVDNPAQVLCEMLAGLRDGRGRIRVPGFYDDVQPLTKHERRQLARAPETDSQLKKLLGVRELFGESGYTSTERRAARPTLEINGLTSGYQGEGSKTIVPACASAKLTFRLVPDQSPKKILRAVKKRLQELCPRTVRFGFEAGHCGDAYLVSPTGAQAAAALSALRSAFGREPILVREGGSIPIVNDFKRILGVDTLLLGLGLPDDKPHSPNEKFDLGAFSKGMRMSAALWRELAGA